MTLDELQKEYEKQQKKVIASSKLYNLFLVGKYFKNRLIRDKTKLRVIFIKLRDETRKINPELFISSEGSKC